MQRTSCGCKFRAQSGLNGRERPSPLRSLRGRTPGAATDDSAVSPLTLECQFADAMAFFASGHVAYTLSVILRPESFPQRGASADRTIPVFPGVLLSLLELARTDTNSALRHNVKFSACRRRPDLQKRWTISSVLDFTPWRTRPTKLESGFIDCLRGIIWPRARRSRVGLYRCLSQRHLAAEKRQGLGAAKTAGRRRSSALLNTPICNLRRARS